MRYTIEAKGKRQEGIVEELLKKEKNLKLVDKYDPFEKLGGEVERIGLALRKFKTSGIDWSVFNYYLRGRGLPQNTIDSVIGDVEDFFQRVGLLEKDN